MPEGTDNQNILSVIINKMKRNVEKFHLPEYSKCPNFEGNYGKTVCFVRLRIKKDH